MLGLGKAKNVWNWAACGKHPVARDYFRINSSTSLFVAFENWIEKGYEILSKKGRTDHLLYSWRFWAKGIKKGNLICGVAKDSSDSIGRPYPLLIMGDGMFDGWEEHWNLLPDAFEKTWDQMEYISSRRFDDLKGLEKEVYTIKNPRQDWLEMTSQNRKQGKLESLNNTLVNSMDNDEIREKMSRLDKKKEVLVPLDSPANQDPLAMVSHWNCVLKAYRSDVPNAVFLGGVPEKHFLAVFNRSLNANDFVRLWSVSSI